MEKKIKELNYKIQNFKRWYELSDKQKDIKMTVAFTLIRYAKRHDLMNMLPVEVFEFYDENLEPVNTD